MGLWGFKPHSRLVLDKVSPIEQLDNTKAALQLINEKINNTFTSILSEISWTQRAIKLIEKTQKFQLVDVTNEHVQALTSVVMGKQDLVPLGELLDLIDESADSLNEEGLLVDDYAELAHRAISHWLVLEKQQYA